MNIKLVIIFFSLFFVGKAIAIPSIDGNAFIALVTTMQDDKDTYERGGKSALNWAIVKTQDPKGTVSMDDAMDLMFGNLAGSDDEDRIAMYSLYYMFKLNGINEACALNRKCVVESLHKGANVYLNTAKEKLIVGYVDDKSLFKFPDSYETKVFLSMDKVSGDIASNKLLIQ
nr:hypothetical protein [Providencia stuartii]ELR5081619.1 hypothetical protein [Providencia stuartii]